MNQKMKNIMEQYIMYVSQIDRNDRLNVIDSIENFLAYCPEISINEEELEKLKKFAQEYYINIPEEYNSTDKKILEYIEFHTNLVD